MERSSSWAKARGEDPAGYGWIRMAGRRCGCRGRRLPPRGTNSADPDVERPTARRKATPVGCRHLPALAPRQPLKPALAPALRRQAGSIRERYRYGRAALQADPMIRGGATNGAHIDL